MPASGICLTLAMPWPQRMLADGQWTMPVSVRAKVSDPRIVEENRVGEPHVRADPVDRLREGDRAHAVGVQAVGLLVEVLREVRVQHNARVATREPGRFAHQVRRHREGRAGRDHDPAHRVAGGVVVAVNQSLGVAQDRGLVLDAAVGRQPALARAARHGASRRVEAQAHGACRADLRVRRAVVRQDVEVVGTRRAARHHQLGHGDLGACLDRPVVEAAPDRIEGREPYEGFVVLRHHPRQVLVHVVMCVDEVGHDEVARPVEHAVGRHLGEVGRRADPLDDVVAQQEGAVADLPARVVERCEQRDVDDFGGRHQGAADLLGQAEQLAYERPVRPRQLAIDCEVVEPRQLQQPSDRICPAAPVVELPGVAPQRREFVPADCERQRLSVRRPPERRQVRDLRIGQAQLGVEVGVADRGEIVGAREGERRAGDRVVERDDGEKRAR